VQPRADPALRARAAAARTVLEEAPGVDRYDLLAAVVWPMRPELKAVEQRLNPRQSAREPRPASFPARAARGAEAGGERAKGVRC
jgi:hypothetical protein